MNPCPFLVSVVAALVATACALEPHDYGPGDDAGMDSEPAAEQPAEPQPDGASESVVPDAPSDAGASDTPTSDAFPCVPMTCTSANASCGTTADGCGGTLDCGACPLGEECGGAGLPNHCAAASDGGPDADAGPSCTPGERACVGLQTYECDPSGNWVAGATCSTVCVNGACEDTCPLPWGGTLGHGQSTTAFLNVAETSPETCDDHMETRTCNNGVLSGSYSNPTCVKHHRDCALPGYGTLLHGTQVTSYAADSVPCGSTCASVTVSCSDGTLSGGSSYHGSCGVGSCPVCGTMQQWLECTVNQYVSGVHGDDSSPEACASSCGQMGAACAKYILYDPSAVCVCHSAHGIGAATGSFAPGNSSGWTVWASECF